MVSLSTGQAEPTGTRIKQPLCGWVSPMTSEDRKVRWDIPNVSQGKKNTNNKATTAKKKTPSTKASHSLCIQFQKFCISAGQQDLCSFVFPAVLLLFLVLVLYNWTRESEKSVLCCLWEMKGSRLNKGHR